MRQVRWSQSASIDLNRLMSHIAEENERNATLVGDRIDQTAKNLGLMATGHFGRVEDTYEIRVTKSPYVIAYGKTETMIVILRVIHGARDGRLGEWPMDK